MNCLFVSIVKVAQTGTSSRISSTSGIMLHEPDGKLHNCYPIVMSFMVDYPEACLLCLVWTNYACPVCMAPRKDFSCLDKKYPHQTVPEMKKKIAKVFSLFSNGEKENGTRILKDCGLQGQTVCINTVMNIFLDILNCSQILFSYLYRIHYGNYLTRIFTEQLHLTCYIKLRREFGNISST